MPTYTCAVDGDTLSTLGTEATYYCNKYCAMSHCKKLNNWGCKAVDLYKRRKHPATDIKSEACSTCEHLQECTRDGCVYDVGPEAIEKCKTCSQNSCDRAKPHVLKFNKKWEAPCPVCERAGRRGTLKPDSVKSFSTYIKKLFENSGMDHGASFCSRFQEEISKVVEIQQILRADKSREK